MKVGFTFLLGLRTSDGIVLTDDLFYNAQWGDGIKAYIAYVLGQYGVECFGLTEVTGYWRGVEEPGLSIYVHGIDFSDAQAIARELAVSFQQESVGVRPEQALILVDNPSTD